MSLETLWEEYGRLVLRRDDAQKRAALRAETTPEIAAYRAAQVDAAVAAVNAKRVEIAVTVNAVPPRKFERVRL